MCVRGIAAGAVSELGMGCDGLRMTDEMYSKSLTEKCGVRGTLAGVVSISRCLAHLRSDGVHTDIPPHTTTNGTAHYTHTAQFHAASAFNQDISSWSVAVVPPFLLPALLLAWVTHHCLATDGTCFLPKWLVRTKSRPCSCTPSVHVQRTRRCVNTTRMLQ